MRLFATFLAFLVSFSAFGQDKSTRQRVDVVNYTITAEIMPATQSIAASAKIDLTPLDTGITTLALDLSNALNVSQVTDTAGKQLPASQSKNENALRITFPEALVKGTTYSIIVKYDGKLTGNEESSVPGIKFAAIHPTYAYLMYPARWFPVNDYSADRFTMNLAVTVPSNLKVIASGFSTTDKSGGKTTYNYKYSNSSFPGSIAVVEDTVERVSVAGVTTEMYFRGEHKALAKTYGEETAKAVNEMTELFGLAPSKSLTLVETEDGTPNGYAAPNIIFLASRAIGNQVNQRLLVNQVARQWYGMLTSPVSRNHIWIANGVPRYAEMMSIEQASGAAALEAEAKDIYIEAMTVDNPPLIQSSRLEDYSPEYWAATAGKGATVLHMLRYVIGDEKFKKGLKLIPERFAWKSLSTEDFKKVMEEASGDNLDYFFLQWIESTGAPEFKMEYTVYRTAKGFRVMGKVSQDLDTFRMPVELQIETEGNPEMKKIEVAGTSSEFVVETFGRPKKVDIDPSNRVLRFNNQMRVAVAIRKGEQFAEIGEYPDALKEYQKALEVSRNSSLSHYRVGEVFFLQNNYQSAANEFRESLNGDLEPKWTEVWGHINLGKIFDITSQRERAVNEYNLAIRTKDNTQGAQEEAAKYLKETYKRPRREVN